MTISTRTPEGDPLKCVVCGKEHLVLSSNPPGDSVCPTCGSHSWIVLKKIEAQFPTAEVLQIVPVFVDKIRLSRSKMEMAAHLVDGLFEGLSPQGVTLWLMSPFGQRLVTEVPLVEKNKLTVAGMVEVVQRTEIPFDAREGSFRFVRSMVAVSSGFRAFTNLEFETS